MTITASVKAKIVLIIVSITTACLVVGYSLVLINDYVTFRDDAIDNSLLMARVVAEYSVSDLAFNDHRAASETLSKLNIINEIECAVLYDVDGDELARYGDAAAQPARDHLPGRYHFSDNSLHILQPVIYQGETYGNLYLRTSTAPLRTKLIRHVGVMGSMLLIVLIGGGVVALRMQRVVSAPILRLSATARRITETGDYSIRVSKTGEDEIGQLCENINELLDQIHQREIERDVAELRTREKSQFLAAMSHELRTPLNSIIGFSNVMLKNMSDKLPDKGAKFLENINVSGQHLLGIINDILDLSKVEAGKMNLELEIIEISSIVDGVTAVMRGSLEKRRIAIDIDVANDLPPIMADAVKLKQILYNLLSNAVKFSPEKSVVTISARELSAGKSGLGVPAVALAVSDEGIGISPEQQAQIFEPFAQADDSTARRFGGTGLGLSLVRVLVEMHRGQIHLDSSTGQGSTFTVVIPRDSLAAEPEDTSLPIHSLGASRRLLLVAEESELLTAVRTDLQSGGFDIDIANSWEIALDQLQSRRPAAILIDLRYPDLTGWSNLYHIKRHGRSAGIPVVLGAGPRDGVHGVAVGAEDFFCKSQDMNRLCALLKSTAAPSGAQAIRTVIVSDDRAFQHTIKTQLAPSGIQLEEAMTVDQGVERSASGQIDIVVIDLATEGMKGLECSLRLRTHPRTHGIPRVLVGPPTLDDDQRARLGEGLHDLMTRYSNAGPLWHLVKDLLSRQAPRSHVESIRLNSAP